MSSNTKKGKYSRAHIRCGNCGKKGHIYKDCLKPVMSMGIICCQYEDTDISINDIIKNRHKVSALTSTTSPKTKSELSSKLKYLIICRKHSMAFVEFIRGKYDITKPNYIKKLFERMTLTELLHINKSTYKELYTKLWQNNVETQYYLNEYVKASKKFNDLKEGYKHNGKLLTLNILLNSVDCKWVEPEWGFPKGRRNNNETDFDCANREFKEETDFTDSQYSIINLDPVSETYTSVNKIKYKHIYYLAQSTSSSPSSPKVSSTNKSQAIEVSKLGWYTYEEALAKFRDYQTEKVKVLETVHNTLLNILQ